MGDITDGPTPEGARVTRTEHEVAEVVAPTSAAADPGAVEGASPAARPDVYPDDPDEQLRYDTSLDGVHWVAGYTEGAKFRRPVYRNSRVGEVEEL